MCTGTSLIAIAGAGGTVSAGTAAAIGVGALAVGAAVSGAMSKHGGNVLSQGGDPEAERRAMASRAAQEAMLASNVRRQKVRAQTVLGSGGSIDSTGAPASMTTYGKPTLGA